MSAGSEPHGSADGAPFSRRAIGLLLALGAVSLVAAVAGALVSKRPPDSSATDSFSRSAIGHRAFVELLQAIGQPVLVSRWDSGNRAQHGLLVIAEPDLRDDGRVARIQEMMASAHATLIVLPKRTGDVAGARSGWIGSQRAVDANEVRFVLGMVGVEYPDVARAGEEAVAVRLAASNVTGATPVLASAQLVRSESLQGILTMTNGDVLLGRVVAAPEPGGRFVLTDPDLIATHGLNESSNAQCIVDVIRHLTPQAGAVVVDEVLHGYAQAPSLLRELFEFPLVLLTVQIGLLGAVAVWAGLGRFGAPVADRPPIAAGKAALLSNTAELLHFGGHRQYMVERYANMLVDDVARALHAPHTLARAELLVWLRQAGRARGARIDPAVALRRAIRATTAIASLEAARDLSRWRTEVLHGLDSNRRA